MNTVEPKTGIINSILQIRNIANELYNTQKIKKYQHQKFIEEIEKLEDIRDSLEFYDNHPLYMLLHRELHRIFKGSVPVDGFIIRINLKPNSTRHALLTFDFYPVASSPEKPLYEFS